MIFLSGKLNIFPIRQKDPRMKVEYQKLLFHSFLCCSSYVFSKEKVVCTVLGMKGIKNFSIVLFVHSMLEFYFSTEEVCLDIGSRKIIGFRVFDHLRLNYQIFKVCTVKSFLLRANL